MASWAELKGLCYQELNELAASSFGILINNKISIFIYFNWALTKKKHNSSNLLLFVEILREGRILNSNCNLTKNVSVGLRFFYASVHDDTLLQHFQLENNFKGTIFANVIKRMVYLSQYTQMRRNL